MATSAIESELRRQVSERSKGTKAFAEAMVEHARRGAESMPEGWETVELHIEIKRGQHKPLVSVSYDIEGELFERGGSTLDCELLLGEGED